MVQKHAERAESLLRELRRQGYDAHGVSSGATALRVHRAADLVLLDLELPDIDGLEICRSIRAAGDTAIICLTSSSAELDRVLALQAGADDCVVTTCGPRELVARIQAVLRRGQARRSPVRRDISLLPLHIDGRAREVRLHGRVVKVTAKEFELLYVLASNPENVMSRKELMARVWEDTWAQSSRTLDTHVSSLRAKLGASQWIITVRGVGYRIGRG